MPLFVLFVFGAVMLGAGAMIAPAWPTEQPRVGLGAALALAVVVGGAVFYASLFGWNILVIDWLLFTLISGIFLGGTLSIGQARAERRGQVLADHEQGWPGPQDLGFFLVVALICAIPAFIFPALPGLDAPQYGYLALVTREGGTFDTFAPFHPEISYLYSPGLSTLVAYLSQQLNQSIALVMTCVGSVLALLNVWVAYDFGAELQDKRLGRAMALAMLLSFGLLGSLLNGHIPAMLGLLFTQAFLIYAIRYIRTRYPVDAIGAGLLLGAVAIAHPGMAIAAGLGYVPWMATIWLGFPKPTQRTGLVMALGIPLVAVIATSPWLIDIIGKLDDFSSPLTRSTDNLTVMVQYHGVWVLAAAALGFWLGWLRRDPVVILAAGWLVMILDFSVTGGIAILLPYVDRFVNPLDLAWHAPIIPYTILGGMGVLWLWDSLVKPRTGSMTYRQTYIVNAVIGAGLIGAVLVAPALGLLMETVIGTDSALISEADAEALEWLRENSDEKGRVLNVPESDGLWTAAISERDAVYYPLPLFANESVESREEQDALRVFWDDPADAANHALLLERSIDYVVIPQYLAEESSIPSWRSFESELALRSSLDDAVFLEPVYTFDGVALVYRVLSTGDLTEETEGEDEQ